MHEIPLVFGSDRHLVGILTLPSTPAPAPIAFVLLNAGVIHRIGPHRINVKLARHLAHLGFASFRFDLSGLGDSRNARSTVHYTDQYIADIRSAMDHLERTANVQRFAIAGICSGADNGWNTAQADARVTALFMIDGYHYPTAKTRWMRYWRRLQGPILGPLARKLVSRLQRLITLQLRPSHSEVAVNDARPFPDQHAYAHTLQTLVDRGVQVQLLFSGSLLPQYNYPEQFKEAFAGHAFTEQVIAAYCPEIDHTVTPLSAQSALMKRVGDWAQSLPGCSPKEAAPPAI